MAPDNRKAMADGAIAACVAGAVDNLNRAIELALKAGAQGLTPVISTRDLVGARDGVSALTKHLDGVG